MKTNWSIAQPSFGGMRFRNLIAFTGTNANALDICAKLSTRCRGVYWCRVPLAWGLPKYQSHTRLQIIYVYIARMRARVQASIRGTTLHDDDDDIDETRRRRRNVGILLVGDCFFFARRAVRMYFWFTLSSGHAAILCYHTRAIALRVSVNVPRFAMILCIIPVSMRYYSLFLATRIISLRYIYI